MIIDTGSSDLIIQNERSNYCQQVSCQYGTADLLSDTLEVEQLRAISIQYAGGWTARADLVKDTIIIEGRTVPDALFGIARESSFAKNILGIGYAANEAILNGVRYSNFPQRLKDVGLIKTVAYSLSLNSQDSGSGILFGGMDTAKFTGKPTTLPLIALSSNSERTHLAVGVSGVAFGPLKGGPFQAVLDCAQTRISLENDITSKIYAAAGVEINNNRDPIRSCALSEAERKMILTFQFSGAAAAVIHVPFKDLLIPESDEPGNYTPLEAGLCYFGVYSAGDDVPTLGMPFFQSAYVVFNLESHQVSLAQAKHNSGGSGGRKIIEIGEGGVNALVGELANGEELDNNNAILNAQTLDYSSNGGQFSVDDETNSSQLPVVVVTADVATSDIGGGTSNSISDTFEAFNHLPSSSDLFSANSITPSLNFYNLPGNSGVSSSSSSSDDVFLSSSLINSGSTPPQFQTNPPPVATTSSSDDNTFVISPAAVVESKLNPTATLDNTQFPPSLDNMSNFF